MKSIKEAWLRKEQVASYTVAANSCKPVRNSYVTIMYQPVTVSSNTCNQCKCMHKINKHSLAYLQDFMPTLADVLAYILYTS